MDSGKDNIFAKRYSVEFEFIFPVCQDDNQIFIRVHALLQIHAPKIGQAASEKMLFENVDNDGGCQAPMEPAA